MADNLKQTPQKAVSKTIEAFYIVPKSGGFQARKLTIEEGIVLDDSPYSDPDAWDQVLSEIEHELSKRFQ